MTQLLLSGVVAAADPACRCGLQTYGQTSQLGLMPGSTWWQRLPAHWTRFPRLAWTWRSMPSCQPWSGASAVRMPAPWRPSCLPRQLCLCATCSSTRCGQHQRSRSPALIYSGCKKPVHCIPPGEAQRASWNHLHWSEPGIALQSRLFQALWGLLCCPD